MAAEADSFPAITFSGAIHRIQLSLFDGTCTDDRLFAAGALLSRPDYEDVVVERSITLLCGYPTCPNPLPSERPRKGRYRISLSEHRVYDLQETYKYCSEACVVSSRAFSGSLPAERCSAASPTKISELLRLFENLTSEEEGAKKTAGEGSAAVASAVGDGDLGFSKLTIHEKSDVKAGEVSAAEWIGPSNAMEGYVPKRDRNLGSSSKTKTKPKLKTKPKPTRGDSDTTGNVAEFTSTIIMGDPFSVAPQLAGSSSLVSKLEGLELGVKKLEDGVSVGKKAESREPSALKPSLKSAGAKTRNRSVKWVDEERTEATVERMESPVVERTEVSVERTDASVEREVKSSESLCVSNNEDDDHSLRRATAEACAAALTKAAEAVASGKTETGDAVSEAGIVILPPPNDVHQGDVESEEDSLEFERGSVKWPKKPVFLDTDMFEVDDSWHDTPPEGFGLTLSPFGTMFMSLFGWITCSSLAYIYGQDEGSQDEFLSVNGREYPHKIVLPDGRSAEIRQTLAGCIARALPNLITDLHLRTPISVIEKAMGHLLETMTFIDALPAFKIKQWHVIVFLFIDALSVHRIPALGSHVTNNRVLLHKVLNASQISGEEYETMKDLLLPLGRVPQFSMQSGG